MRQPSSETRRAGRSGLQAAAATANTDVSASSGIAASEKVKRSIVQPSYPTIARLRLGPSFERPIQKLLWISGTSTRNPVWRIRQFSA